MLFIPDCDVNITLYFFTTLDGCCLLLVVIRTTLFIFLTTPDGCHELACLWPKVSRRCELPSQHIVDKHHQWCRRHARGSDSRSGNTWEVHPICTRGCNWAELTHPNITTHSKARKGKRCLVHDNEEMEEPTLTQASPHHQP